MSCEHEYKTVFRHAEAELIEKKSRFIAHVKPIDNEDEAIEFINSLKAKYWDATHNVYAYLLHGNIQRYSDDGEPTGTAGIPTLEVIRKEELKNVVVVVTRYFGGTMLGAGGLVRAYGKSAKEGLVAAGIIRKKLCHRLMINADYTLLGKIQNEIALGGDIIDEILYQEDVCLSVLIPVSQTESFIKNMIDTCNGRVKIVKKDTKYIAVNEHGKLVT